MQARPEERAVGVEAPAPPRPDDLQPSLVPAHQELVVDPRPVVAIDEGNDVRAMPVDVNDGHIFAGHDARDERIFRQILKSRHPSPVV